MGDQYLTAILAREAVDTSFLSPALSVKATLTPVINTWGGPLVQSVVPSGSFAKGTANASGTDVDLFISLHPSTPRTLREIYLTLFNALRDAGYAPRKQDVSLGIRVGLIDVDLVPGKQQSPLTTDHSLYRSRADTWIKTNVQTHIDVIRAAGRQQETRIIKLWRDQNNLNFPSVYLELVVIRALQFNFSTSLAERVWAVLQLLSSGFSTARVVDPANGNNVISDDLTFVEKLAIERTAQVSLSQQTWGSIVK
ncbi:nucleotidyltransferase domain-containing protein [Stenotrophomonas sepilia]|uniref:nucleotidyltransferase domain-containing protein n=1 Tax=Stenotrophomonas sepilia TaxID=2860290 RepID=UPI002E768CE3|nr:nucleotidyltransferase domain-containing protein [Stenotrophomonas sepilia]